MEWPNLSEWINRLKGGEVLNKRTEKELLRELQDAQDKFKKLADLEREKDKLREEKQKLTEVIRKLHEQLSECGTKNARYEQALQKVENFRKKLSRPPLTYGVFVRPHPGGKFDEVDVLVDGDFLVVPLAIADLKAADLKCGWEVCINGKMQLVEITKKDWNWGSEVIFKERNGDDRALVTGEHNEVQQCYLSPDLKDVPLKAGDHLLSCNGLLVRLILQTEAKEHFQDLEKLSDMDWSRVGGLTRSVKKIRRKILPFKEREAYLKIFKGKDVERGMILHGPEGCGKTLCAKVIASDLAKSRGLTCYFMEIVGAELVNKYVGETSRKLRELFNRAKEKADDKSLVVIFIDEIDSLFRSRDTASDKEPWMATDIGQFNGILQGMDPLGNILVIGATNRKDLIDKAILRPGRLGIDILIPRPKTERDLAEILKIYLTTNLPFAQKYYVDGPYGYTDWFDGKKKKQVSLDKDPEKIRDHFVDVIVKRLIYKGQPVEISFLDGNDGETISVDNRIRAETSDGDKEIYLKDYLSGAILESIVNGARGIAFERWCEIKEKTGVEPEGEMTKKDFFRAIDEEFQRLKNNFKQSQKKPITGFSA